MDIMFNSNKSVSYVAEYIRCFIINSLGEEREKSNWLNTLCISSKYYTISIESSIDNDDSDISSILQDICKDYDININTSVYVDIYSATYNLGFGNIKCLAKELLDLFTGDALITDDSGIVIFKRIGSKIIISLL